MEYSLIADLVVIIHALFIMFVIFGAALALRWPKLVPVHLLALVWGAAVEFFGWPCPLTPLEQWARTRAGESGYDGGFINHYLMALIYPDGLTRNGQIVLGVLVLVLNLVAYGVIIKWRRRVSKS